MTKEPGEISERQERLQEILLNYVETAQAGTAPDRPTFLAAHPEFAGDIVEFLASYDKLNRLAQPLREANSGRPASEGIRTAVRPAAAKQGDATEIAAGMPGTSAAGELGELGDYRLLREVGRGGMGIVYEAEQISLHRRVAVKILPFAAGVDARQLQRFRNEAEAAAHLHHSHIVPVFAVGSVRGVHFYAMQLIEGQSLASLIAELQEKRDAERGSKEGKDSWQIDALGSSAEGRTPSAPPIAAATVSRFTTEHSARGQSFFQRVAEIGKQAAEALEYAHQMGVVHRDIKPANLLLDGRGQVWITDFGLAQIQSHVGVTLTGEMLGTLRYVSPEQAMAKRGLVDHHTDIYSLGATLYELATLRPVFDGRDRHAILHHIGFDEPSPPRSIDPMIPVEMETIILKSLAKNPSERYGTMQELADDLQRFLDDKPIQAKRPSVVDRTRKWMRRHPSVVAAAVLLLMLGAVGFGVSTALIAREQAHTSAAYQREKQRAQEAEQRFHLARRSADEMIQLAEEELAENPAMHNLRRRLLESALAYYQEFIELRKGDADAQDELAQTRDRVKKILADLAVLQGAGKIFLLKNRDVLEELHLSISQQERVAKLLEQVEKQHHEMFAEFRKLSSEERQKRFLAVARSNESEIAAIFNPMQVLRLRQIALQSQGPMAFLDSNVAASLKLTADQKKQIRSMEATMFMPFDRPGPGGPPSWKSFDDRRRATMKQIEGLLTEEQRQLWQEQVGETFVTTEPFFLPPGPPPGPPPGEFGPHRQGPGTKRGQDK